MRARTNSLLVTAAAAAAVSGGLFAQTEIASIDPEEQLRRQIGELQTETELARPAALVDPLRALAMVHQEAGDHALAIVALEEARHITRVHQGLSSADEALLLRQQIRSEQALGLHERVWELEQDLVTIARHHHDDIRMVPIFRELAEDRWDALEQYRAGRMPPEIYLGCYYVGDPRPYDDKRGGVRPPSPWGDARSDGRGCRSGQSTAVRGRLRWETLTYYADAIEVILKSGDYASQELRDLETEAFHVSQVEPSLSFNRGAPAFGCRRGSRVIPDWALDELLAVELVGNRCLGPVAYASGKPVRANAGGWVSLVRLIAYEIRSGAPAAVRASAIAELADYRLVETPADRRRFDENSGPTLRIYERAYGEVEHDDEGRAAIFSPKVPVTLPPYEPNLFASAAAEVSSRYIDVSFDITKHGRGERIEILATSQGASRGEERDLIRLIETTTFRPRFVDGELAHAAPVVVRYHLGA